MTVFDPAAEQHTAATSAPRARTAAFFDLDKTIIAKSSTLAFSKPFFNQGLLNRRAVLKSSYAQFIYLLSGADHDQMDRMRLHMTNMVTGWDVDQVKSIVNETLHDIVTPLVFAEAADLIAAHKLCGRDVVVVSASGEEIVAP
ncbi:MULTISPECIES: HAD-IB family hydrolase, partial [unclassified Mycobacterium]